MGKQLQNPKIRVPPTSVLALGSPFGRYLPEHTQAVRKADVGSHPKVEEIMKAWELFDKARGQQLFAVPSHDYPASLEGKGFSAPDVETFSIALSACQDTENFPMKAGEFLSALVNSGTDQGYTIHTSHLAELISYSGVYNTKNITTEGNVGDWLCHEMIRGRVLVSGDAGNYCGFGFGGGELVIGGNAGKRIGCEMRHGNIIVKGNAGELAGENMHGGRLTIEGNAGNCCGGPEMLDYSGPSYDVDSITMTPMQKGRIIIKGNAGINVGLLLKGGRIRIYGNAGDSCGNHMSKGCIMVKGDAGNGAGKGMGGGIIIIEGNAGDRCGASSGWDAYEYGGEVPGQISGDGNPEKVFMTGGKIIVNGNVGMKLGDEMKGGEIWVYGDIGSIGNVEHGKIYHKGELVVDK